MTRVLRVSCAITSFFLTLAAISTFLAWPGQSLSADQPQGGSAISIEQLLGQPDVRKGLCIHVGCSDGQLTAQMGMKGKFIVQGLDPDPENVQKARQHIQSKGIYGQVSVECRPVDRLPYTHDITNVVIVDRFDEMAAKGFKVSEAMRILAPYGVAFFGGKDENALKTKLADAGVKDVQIVKADGIWAKAVKPYPADMDEWQQHRHDTSRTSVSKDKQVGPVSGIRWIQGELWSNLFRPVGCILSANGRTFYLKLPEPDDANKAYRLEARDSFNGLKLWEKIIQARGQKELSAATFADKVYANLANKEGSASVAVIDAQSGEVTKTLPVQGDLSFYKGNLIVRETKDLWTVWDPVKGEKIREFTAKKAYSNAPIIIADDLVFFADSNTDSPGSADSPKSVIVCVDYNTAKEKWRMPNIGDGELFWVNKGMLLTEPVAKSWGPKEINAFSIQDGKSIWKYPSCSKKGNYLSAFIMGDVMWTYDQVPISQEGKYIQDESKMSPEFKKNTGYIGLDPATGQKKQYDLGWWKEFGRCGPDSATERYIMSMDMFVYDLAKNESFGCYIVRGDCGISYTPANGLLYQYGHQCACSSYVCGVMGISADPVPSVQDMKARAGEPLEKGPAYGAKADGQQPGPTDWPAFRHDSYRSGASAAQVPAELKVQWKIKANGKISSPTAANGTIYVSAIDEQKVLAIDSKTGKNIWTFTAGGRVDTPPTYHAGLLLFGSRDGYVYCLKASGGELVWKLRAAPEDRRIVVRDRVESVWPLNGTVIVENGIVYVAAGRHCDSDGGVFFYAIEPETGKIIWDKNIVGFPPYRTDSHQKTIASRSVKDPQKYDTLSDVDKGLLGGYERSTYNDILVSDGKTVFIGAIPMDIATRNVLPISPAPALYGGGGTFLCDNSRPGYGGGRNQWALIGNTWRKNGAPSLASGNGIVIDDKRIYSLHQGDEKGKTMGNVSAIARPEGLGLKNQAQPASAAAPAKGWQKAEKDNLRMIAIIAAGDKVFVACQPGGSKFGGAKAGTGEIRIYSTENGSSLGKFDLGAEPAFDGMAAIDGCLLVTTQDGELICLNQRPFSMSEQDCGFGGQTEMKRTLLFSGSAAPAEAFDIEWQLNVAGAESQTGKKNFTAGQPLPEKFEITLKLPPVEERKTGEFIVRMIQGGVETYRQSNPISVINAGGAAKPAIEQAALAVWDPFGSVKARLQARGVAFTEVAKLQDVSDSAKLLVVGKDAITGKDAGDPAWRKLTKAGTRILILEQQSPPAGVMCKGLASKPGQQGKESVIENQQHPAFAGLESFDLSAWSKDGVVFRLPFGRDAAKFRSLAQCDDGRSTCIAEFPTEAGLFLSCQMTVGEKLSTDAAAQRLFDNLLNYAAAFVPRSTASAIDETTTLGKSLAASGLKFEKSTDVITAISEGKFNTVMADASPANVKKLADNADKVKSFASAGGWLVLCGLAPEGLSDFNRLVGVNHIMRPLEMEKVTVPEKPDLLVAGLSEEDLTINSFDKPSPWQADRYPAEDGFSFVVDYDDIAPFCVFPGPDYWKDPEAKPRTDHWPRNMINGLTSDWKYSFVIHLDKQEPNKWTITLPREEEIVEFSIHPDVSYHKLTKIRLTFDDDQASPVTINPKPAGERQNFPIQAHKTKQIQIDLAEWEKSGSANVIGVYKLWIRAKRPDDFFRKVTPLANIGVLTKYPIGKGGIILNQARFLAKDETDKLLAAAVQKAVDQEKAENKKEEAKKRAEDEYRRILESNAQKKQKILVRPLWNLGAEFGG